MKKSSSPSIEVWQEINVIYQVKCLLGDCMSENNNIFRSTLNYPIEKT